MQQVILEDLVKLQSKGLLTIPKKMRQKLGFRENSLVRVKEEKGRLVVEPVRTLEYSVRSYTERELREFIELDKKEAKELKKKGLL